jgi:hypothetical protein
MFNHESLLFKEIQARGVIKLADVLRLRRDYLHDGAQRQDEAQALLALNAACPVQDMSWTPFLVETTIGYIVKTAKPEGYLTVAKARWLISHAANGGRIERLSCLELLITALETARWSPPSLAAFILRQIELDIVTGVGPLRTGATSGKGRVGQTAVSLIRRVLAAGNRGGTLGDGAISRAEAEVLLDIHDATVSADNCLEWTELFTKIVAHILLIASGYIAPARSQSLLPESWFDSAIEAEAFLEVLSTRGFRAVLAAYTQPTPEEQALAHLEHHKVEIITSETMPAIEPVWLAARLQKAPALTPATQALFSFLRAQERMLHPALRPLLDKAA